MIVENTENLECTLEPLENVVPDLKDRYILSLKSGANRDEVLHKVRFIGERILAYQFGTYYEYLIEVPNAELSTDIEDFRDHENRINNTKEDFSRFNFRFKGTLVNKHKKKNKGPDKLENIDWVFSESFVNVYDLPKAGFVNTEDLTFNNPACNFFGRSMNRLFLQEYIKHHPEKFKRNFEIIKCDDPRFEKSASELIKQMRNLSLSREESVKVLQNIKCLETGKDLTVLLDKDFTVGI